MSRDGDQDPMRLYHKFNESFNKIARPEEIESGVYDSSTVASTMYGGYDLACGGTSLPPPPTPYPPPPPSVYYNYGSGGGLVSPVDWYPGVEDQAAPSYLTTASSPNSASFDSWSPAHTFPPPLESGLPSYTTFTPSSLGQHVTYLQVPELDDALNVLKTHADISQVPVVAHKTSANPKLEMLKTEVEECKPSSSGEGSKTRVRPSAKRSRSQSDDGEGSEDASMDPEDKEIKHSGRRWANNQRERVRIKDINGALKELGRICHSHQKSDKPMTKLGVLNNAVDIIMGLERQVRDRNLNPKVACLKRQETSFSSMASLGGDNLAASPSYSLASPLPSLPYPPHGE